MTYTPKTFNLPALEGLSEKQVKVHLGLYEGYVKHVNLIMEKLQALKAADAEANAYLIAELRRRFAAFASRRATFKFVAGNIFDIRFDFRFVKQIRIFAFSLRETS